MDASELAMKMLEWEAKRRVLDILEIEIEDAVLAIGNTQTVGNVRAIYNAGRKNYDYAKAAVGRLKVSDAVVRLFTVTPQPKTDWRAVCEHAGIEKDEISFTQAEPSVKIKLL